MKWHPDSRPRVLFVDHAGRGAASIALLREHYDVQQAASGEQALVSAAQMPPDLVVLDVPLPDLDAADVARRLRTDRRTRATGILQLIAAGTATRTLASTLDQGADTYVTHPVEPRELRAQVDALLRIRAAERHSRRLAFEWKSTFDAITDAILVLHRDGSVLQCNRAAARLLRRPRAHVVGQALRDVLRSAAGLDALADLANPERIGHPHTTELPVGSRWYRLAVDPIVGEEGQPHGDAVLVLTDITELKTLEEELRQHSEELTLRNRRQEEFLALLAHELRNPLAAIAAAHETLSRHQPRATLDTEDERRTALDVIQRQSLNLTRMVSDLLDVSRITKGRVTLERAPLDLRDCTRRAVEAIRASASAREHTLVATLPEVPVPVYVDGARIEQVLANLLDNAVKYTDPGGRIEVKIRRESHGDRPWAVLSVRDTGAGMPPDRIAEAFDMFVQYERTLDRAQGGLGLGLHLVKRIVELHGGRVTAHSDGPDLGSVVHVHLPQHEGGCPSETAGRAAPSETEPERHLRILLVEDNRDLRRLTARNLRRAGHVVTEAEDGVSGRDAALGQAFDAIVLDVGLPGMEGYGIARTLRREGPNQQAHLIALTGYGSAQDQAKAREAGFDHHLVKPARLSTLKEVLQNGRQSTPDMPK